MDIQRTSLGSVSKKIDYGLTASATDRNTGVRFLRITDIQSEKVNWDTVPYCNCDEEEVLQYQLKKGDIVFARTGATTGKSYLIDTFPEGSVFASYLIRVRPQTNKLDPVFLSYFFRTPEYWHQIIGSAVGAAQVGFNATKLKELIIPLPPLAEQKRIAAILSKADRLRRLRRTARELSDGYLQAVFLEMFGGEEKHVPLDKLVTITGGGTPSRKIKAYFEGYIPWLTAKDMIGDYINDTQEHVTEEAIKKSATKLVPAGSILVVVKSKILMRRLPLAITKVNLCHGQDIKSIQCSDRVLPEFMVQVLKYNSPQLLQQARGANTEGLTLPMLREVTVPDVSIPLQQKFAHIVHKYERLRAQQRESARQAEHLFQSLLHAAFQGEI